MFLRVAVCWTLTLTQQYSLTVAGNHQMHRTSDGPFLRVDAQPPAPADPVRSSDQKLRERRGEHGSVDRRDALGSGGQH